MLLDCTIYLNVYLKYCSVNFPGVMKHQIDRAAYIIWSHFMVNILKLMKLQIRGIRYKRMEDNCLWRLINWNKKDVIIADSDEDQWDLGNSEILRFLRCWLAIASQNLGHLIGQKRNCRVLFPTGGTLEIHQSTFLHFILKLPAIDEL